jgi:hypothetical protein
MPCIQQEIPEWDIPGARLCFAVKKWDFWFLIPALGCFALGLYFSWN